MPSLIAYRLSLIARASAIHFSTGSDSRRVRFSAGWDFDIQGPAFEDDRHAMEGFIRAIPEVWFFVGWKHQQR